MIDRLQTAQADCDEGARPFTHMNFMWLSYSHLLQYDLFLASYSGSVCKERNVTEASSSIAQR